MKIRRLSELDLVGGAATPLNVCVVSSEFIGPVKNGGIGTATSGLLKQLAADGHRVTLLYTLVEYGKPASGDRSWLHWVETLEAEAITLEHIDHDADYRSWREKSWRVKEFIGQRDFDLVYFNDHHGSGYYSLAAKRAGLHPFANQLHCVITHGSMEWVFEINDQYARGVADLEMMGLERRSVECADVVIGPSEYLLSQYGDYGWRLPEQTFVQPYPLFRDLSVEVDASRVPVNELVFFGRLEVRKGLWVFCEALDQLVDRISGLGVTFLGKLTDTSGLSSGLQIINRSSSWPCRVKLLTDFSQQEALSYLRKRGRLAVMPSLADNSPCVIYECMEEKIPFLSTLGSGADELVDPDSWADVMTEPTAEALAERLADILDRGAALGRPRFNPQDNLATWSAWHRHVAENRDQFVVRTLASSGGGVLADPTRPKTALIVIVDSGRCALSLLVDNLSAHVKRFGGRAAYLILSSRRGELQEALLALFAGSGNDPPAPICILDANTIEEARGLIFGSEFVFFVEPQIDLQTPFFILALTLMEEQPGPVSCAVAVQRDTGEPQVEDLPSGDVPGVGGLGYSIGSGVWAIPAKRLATELASLEFYNSQLDVFTSSADLCQAALQQCRLANLPVHVLPLIGAVEMRGGDQLPPSRSFRDVRRSAAALGIPQSVYSGGAPWIAVSAFGAHLEPTERVPIDCASALAADHPLRTLQFGDDLAALAAAMGRAELALQLDVGKGASAQRVRYLTDLATKSARLRPSWDLLELLREGKTFEFGRDLVPTERQPEKAVASSKDTKERREGPLRGSGASGNDVRRFARAYIDARRIRVRHDKVQASADLAADRPGKIVFVDVPLCGHRSLVTRIRSSGSDPFTIRMTSIDQRTGAEMGATSASLLPKEKAELSIPLFEVFGRAAILCEFRGRPKMEITIEELRIE
jgi:glycosyltransferase involved in cell wall biosynthesis